MNNRIKILIPISVVLYVVSLFGVYFDKEYAYRWLWLTDWLLAILIIPVYTFLSRKHIFNTRLILSLSNNYYWIILILAVLISRFIFIDTYPFASVGDELRDGGYVVSEILRGSTKKIFDYGPYNGFGLIAAIPLIPFQLILGTTTLAFKIPAALISSLDIILIFTFLKKHFNEKIALLTALVICSLPIHMYYGRTEVLVMESSLLTTSIIFLLDRYITNPTQLKLVCLGLIMGFSLNFQPSMRIVILIVICSIIIFWLAKFKKQIKHIFQRLSLLTLMFLVGFGPTILYSNVTTFFQLNKTNPYTVMSFPEAILQSLGVYFLTPTKSHYYLHAPILNIFYAIIFCIGLITLLRKNNYLKSIALFASIIIPITNSAITNWVNADHRLTVLFVFIAIFVAYGIESISKIPKQYDLIKLSIMLLLLVVPIFNINLFFVNNYAAYSMFWDTNNKTYLNFVNRYIGDTINGTDNYSNSKTICIKGSTNDFTANVIGHMKESYYYQFNNGKIIEYRTDSTLTDRTYVISTSCDYIPKYQNKIEYCEKYEQFKCPFDEKPFTIIEQ